MTATLTPDQVRRILTDAVRLRERVLTVRQPWAGLIVSGVKDVENRTWPVPSTLPCQRSGGPHDHDASTGLACTPFPFRLWVHAGQKFDMDALDPARQPNVTAESYRLDSDARGVLLGSVTVTGCHHADECIFDRHSDPMTLDEQYCSRWAKPDRWHWTLADPQPLADPIPLKGRQGLWTLPEGVNR